MQKKVNQATSTLLDSFLLIFETEDQKFNQASKEQDISFKKIITTTIYEAQTLTLDVTLSLTHQHS